MARELKIDFMKDTPQEVQIRTMKEVSKNVEKRAPCASSFFRTRKVKATLLFILSSTRLCHGLPVGETTQEEEFAQLLAQRSSKDISRTLRKVAQDPRTENIKGTKNRKGRDGQGNQLHQQQNHIDRKAQIPSLHAAYHDDYQNSATRSCALLFYGLPRAYDTLVLPTIKSNVLTPHNLLHCDFFVHYYNDTMEEAGRHNDGGLIFADSVLKLKDAVLDMYSNVEMGDGKPLLSTSSTRKSSHLELKKKVRGAAWIDSRRKVEQRDPPMVRFAVDTTESFMERYEHLLRILHDKLDGEGNPLYFPWKEHSYLPSSIDNIIKMWHSIQEVWNLMEFNGRHDTRYDTVAVIRNDVAYLTPLDLADTGVDPTTNLPNDPSKTVTIPGFDKWPVSDRAIYGPYDAVKVWATQRFHLLEQHVQYMYQKHRGRGMHHERFFKYTMFPEMKRQFYHITHPSEVFTKLKHTTEVTEEEDRALLIRESPTMCFLRVRADDQVIISDCQNYAIKMDGHSIHTLPSIKENLYRQDALAALERAIGRRCEEDGRRQYEPNSYRNQRIPCKKSAMSNGSVGNEMRSSPWLV